MDNKESPAVSVIVGVYNTALYLRQCLDSIVNQSLRDIEIILVDDGSTDGSNAILREYAVKDKRVILIEQENSGPGLARNAGLAVARGKYLSFLDSDDYFKTTMLEKMYRKAEKENCDVVVCQWLCFDNESGKKYYYSHTFKYWKILKHKSFSPGDYPLWICNMFVGWAWDKLIKKELVERSGLKYPPLHGPEDVAFILPVILSAGRIGLLDNIFIYYRENNASSVLSTHYKSPLDFSEALRIVKNFLVQNDIYVLYEQSYINYALQHCIWALNLYIKRKSVTAQNAAAYEVMFSFLRDIYFNELELYKYDESYFYDNKYYREYKKIMSMPFGQYVLQRYADAKAANIFFLPFEYFKKFLDVLSHCGVKCAARAVIIRLFA